MAGNVYNIYGICNRFPLKAGVFRLDIGELKNSVIREIESRSTQLEELSRKIHDNPETAFEEHRAAEWLSAYLEANGFALERGIC